jgi:hypothetical protein
MKRSGVVHLVPDVLEQNHLTERCGQREQLLDLHASSFIDFIGWPIVTTTNDDQHGTAPCRVRDAQAVFDILATGRPFLFLRTGQSLAPVSVIDRVMDKHARFSHGIASLLGGERSRFVEVDTVKSGLARQLQSLGERQVFPIDLFGNHP